mgnify:CR=1 FL=1
MKGLIRSLAVIVGLAAVAAALPSGGFVAADGGITLSILGVDDSKFPDVTAIVMADLRGRPIADLRPEDVRVEDLGVPAQVLSVRRAGTETPLALVLVLDTSGSMGPQYGDSLRQAQEAAVALVNGLRAGDRVALISFANDVVVQVPFTQDRAAVVNAIRGLQAYGNTALYQAVAEAARLAGEAGIPRRAVVLLTDGEDFGGRSQVGRDESLNLAAASAPQFLVIGLGQEIDRQYLAELAARTQGRYVEAPGPADLAGAFGAMAELLRSHLEVTYRVGNQLDRTDRNVKITLTRDGATGTAERAYTNSRPVVVAPPAPPPAPVPAPEPRVAEPQPLLTPLEQALLGVGVLGLVAAGAVLVVRRLRREPEPELMPLPDDPIDLPPPVYTPPEVPDVIEVVLSGGPPQLLEARFAIGPEPQTIGWAEDCQIRLPEAPGFAPEHARVWLQEARLILHHLAPGTTTLVNGEPVVWASVGEGDEFKVGPYVFTCRGMVRSGGLASGTRSGLND